MTVGATAVLVKLQLRPIRFARRAVKPRVFSLVDVARIPNALENFLHNRLMTRLARADKIVVRYVKQLPKLLETVNNRVDVLKRRLALSLRGALNFLPVLVAARQEKNFTAAMASAIVVQYACPMCNFALG